MATSSTTVDMSGFTTDAKFRTWGTAVQAAVVASGLTVTADTGQINWTTVLRATAANTKQGYEIYRFNDSLQSSAPIYLRLDYGSGANASGQNANLWITAGTGTDGAGNITGTYFPVQPGTTTSANASTNTTTAIRAAYSTSAGSAFIDAGANQATGVNVSAGTWVIQRTCDSNGTPTVAGLAISRLCGVASSSNTQWPISFNPYTVFASRNVAVGALTSTATSVSGGGVIELYRNWVTCPTPTGTLGSFGYSNVDIAANTVFAAAPFGVTNHNYLALGGLATAAGGGFEQSNLVNISAAVIWE